jgi:hypothetical protein
MSIVAATKRDGDEKDGGGRGNSSPTILFMTEAYSEYLFQIINTVEVENSVSSMRYWDRVSKIALRAASAPQLR